MQRAARRIITTHAPPSYSCRLHIAHTLSSTFAAAQLGAHNTGLVMRHTTLKSAFHCGERTPRAFVTNPYDFSTHVLARPRSAGKRRDSAGPVSTAEEAEISGIRNTKYDERPRISNLPRYYRVKACLPVSCPNHVHADVHALHSSPLNRGFQANPHACGSYSAYARYTSRVLSASKSTCTPWPTKKI